MREMLEIAQSHGWTKKGRGRLPTVRDMAESSGLLALYEFMYAATSQWVHFNPHLLWRLGRNQREPHADISRGFSTKSFAKYHASFSRFYSAYILLLSAKRFVAEFEDGEAATRGLQKLEKKLNGMLRWPELVTHEETGSEPPGDLRLFMRRAFPDENW